MSTASDLRGRVLDLFEQVLDRMGDVVEEAPERRANAMDAARSVGRQVRSSEIASAAVVAGAPAVARAISERVASRRSAAAAVKTVPAIVLSRSAVLGLGVGAVALGGYATYRIVRRRRASGASEGSGQVEHVRDELDDAIARMQDEGGEPAGSGEEPPPSRRFVRAGSGAGSGRDSSS